MIITSKTVLVTGGTGSFGKEFVKRILAKEDPKKVIVFSRDELKQYEMAREIVDDRVRFTLGDVRSMDCLHSAFAGVDIVVHAAALKHVTASETNLREFVSTNVLGSSNVCRASVDQGVGCSILLSTDKAVAPINCYGATKMLAERDFISSNSGGTKFSVVRYGNVLGSRGSVLPMFLRCLQSGRRYPITHMNATRFWITMDQAIELVLTAIKTADPGIFVPKIPSSTVTDLARAIDPDGTIDVVGMGKGEKVHETLIASGERGIEGKSGFFLNDKYDPLPSYSSDTNPDLISAEKVRSLIASFI